MDGNSRTDDTSGTGENRTSTEPLRTPKPEPSKLIIELTNLGEGHLRTVKRELKVIIEDYSYSKMIGGCIRVREVEE